MRPRAQDDVDQHRGVRADRLGLVPDVFECPVAIAPVRTRHVFGDRGQPVRAQAVVLSADAKILRSRSGVSVISNPEILSLRAGCTVLTAKFTPLS